MIKIFFCAVAILISTQVRANLGSTEDSVDSDRKAIAGSELETVHQGKFKVRTIQNHSLKIREYINPQGRVFGLAWDGARHPNLETFLGHEYHSDFSQAIQNQKYGPGRRAFDLVRGQHVIVERSGHMRGMRGKAYVPEMFPQGVTAYDIK